MTNGAYMLRTKQKNNGLKPHITSAYKQMQKLCNGVILNVY